MAAKKSGVTLGRPKGSTSKSKLDGKEQEIASFLDKRVSKACFTRILEVSPITVTLHQDQKSQIWQLLKATE